MPSAETLLTVRDVAAYLACSEETVKRLVRRGELAASRVGRRLRFARADVEAYRIGRRALTSPAGGADAARSYLTRLHLSTGVFTQLRSLEQVAELAVGQCARALGAETGMLHLSDEAGLALIHAEGYSQPELEPWRRLPLAAPLPLPDAVRGGEPCFLEAREALLARYPQLAGAALRSSAWAILPLLGDERAIGGITLGFAQPRGFSAADRAFLLALSQQCAQAIERARLHAAEQRATAEAELARQRLAVLAAASAELAASLDIQDTLETLGGLLVPELADWCVIDLVGDDGAIGKRLAAHVDPARRALAEELMRRYPIDPDAPSGTAAVLRTRRPELIPFVSDEMLALVASDAEHLEMLRALGLRSTLCVPLLARGRALGTIALVHAESGRTFGEADLRFVEELAARAALAIDNARLYQESQAAVRLRDTFFSVAAHELKTPLTSLMGQAQLLQRRAERAVVDLARDRRAVQVIANQAARLNRMILTMLDSTRLEQGQLSLERRPVDLVGLVEQVAEELGPTLDQHQLSVTVGERPLIVAGDALRLEQVLQNLVGNAVKYSPGGGPVRLALSRRGDEAVVEVTDYGIGIPAAALPQLFQRFFRVSEGPAQHISGMGIGLFVVREIVGLHGGQVGVESREGEGSTFTIRLPLAGP